MTDVTLTCPECGQGVTGPESGRGSAAWKLGSHRAQKHNYRNPSKPKRQRPAKGKDKPIMVAALDAAAAEIDDRSSKPPTATELTNAGARFLGTLSVAAASWAAETYPLPINEDERERIADYLSLDPDSAKQIAYPLARALHRSKLNSRYGRSVVDNVDVVSSLAEIGLYAMRWRRHFSEIELARMAAAAHGVAPAPSWQAPPAAAPLRVVPQPVEGQEPGGAGVVLTAEMVEAMKLGRNG